MRHLPRLGTALGLTMLLSRVLGDIWCAMTPEMQAQGIVSNTPSHTPSATPSLTPTPTTTFLIPCPLPACATDEQLHCPTFGPGGCGYICITVTPRMPTPVPRMPLEIIAPKNVHLLKPLVAIFPDSRFTDLAFRGNAEIVTVGYIDRISRWDLPTGRELHILLLTVRVRWPFMSPQALTVPEAAPFFVDVAFTQNTNRLAGAAQVDTVYVWDRAAGEWLTRKAQPDTDLRQVTFSPDELLLAAGSSIDGLLLWDATEQELVKHLPVPAASIVALEFRPDGRYLAAIGWDLKICLWGIPSDVPQPVPEPSTLTLLGISVAVLTGYIALQIRARWRTGTGQ